MWRHHPQVARARELLDGGAIGDLRVIRAHFAFRAADPDDIRLQAELDGGGLMDVGCYCVSGCRTLAGAEPERAYAELVPGGHGVDVALAATLRFPGDVLAHFDCGLTYPGGSLLAAVGTEGSLRPRRPLARQRRGHRAAPRRRLRRAHRGRARELLRARAGRLRGRRARRRQPAARPRRRPRPGPHDRRPLHLGRKERPMPDRLKTSLGIWALGGMVTRFVPVGYQPEHGSESTAEKVRRAVDGLGDLMDDYEFHYPDELSRDNLDEVREALDGHGIYCLASGPAPRPAQRQGRALLARRRASATRRCASRSTPASSPARSARTSSSGRGSRATTTPSRPPTRESWARFIDGVGQAATALAGHGRKLFLEHKNSEPAMKIFMRNIGMTLHVIHKLRAEGIDNVQVNMDWQHLLMNGEHLPEYAALLAAEGLLGHQHANSGWGTSTTTTWSARRRSWRPSSSPSSCAAPTTAPTASAWASTCTRTPRTRSRPSSARCEQWHFIDEVAAAHRRRRPARGAAAQGRRRRLRARLRRAGRARTVAR